MEKHSSFVSYQLSCEGQGSLACCSPWGHKESDMTEWLNWTDQNLLFHYWPLFLSILCLETLCDISGNDMLHGLLFPGFSHTEGHLKSLFPSKITVVLLWKWWKSQRFSHIPIWPPKGGNIYFRKCKKANPYLDPWKNFPTVASQHDVEV